MSDAGSDFTNERKPNDLDVTGQSGRPAYDYGTDGDEERPLPSVRITNRSMLIFSGCGLSVVLTVVALGVFLFAVCSSLGH